MLKKKYPAILKITFFTFILFSSVNGQVKNSIYSMFGIGKIADNSFGVNKSLGGTGIAFQSDRSINYSNPASYLGIPSNSFSVELGVYGLYNMSENKSSYQADYDINFSYFSLSLYVYKWWTALFAIVPYSYVNYEINVTDQIEGEHTTYNKNIASNGGLSRIYIGNSYKIYKGLSAGFNASFVIGNINQTETVLDSENFDGYEFNNKRNVHTFFLDYGLQYSVFKSGLLYTLGLTFRPQNTMNLTDHLVFSYGGTTDTLDESQDRIKIPQKIGIGFSVKKGSDIRAGIDYEWEDWSKINFSNHYLSTRNSHRISVGLEYSPREKGSWANNLYYRLGACYKSTYLIINNVPINSKEVTFGLGIPYNDTDMFNLSVEYGEEGTIRKGLIKNTYWTLHINFSFHEIMRRSLDN